jgi:hypothetical protein
VGAAAKQFPQEPRTITVAASPAFEVEQSIVAHWAIFSVLFTVAAVPLCVWLFDKIVDAQRKRRAMKKQAGFASRQ